MRIAGMQKLTLLDYPGHTAATLFTPGCNYRCPFCHNGELVTPSGPFALASEPGFAFSTEDVLAFLRKRQGLLDGVCVSGGEPLLQPDLARFCEELRALGYAVKIDTNGTQPRHLRELLDADLIDYVAMDVKNAPARYAETAGLPDAHLEEVRSSISLLAERAPAFEFRTTVVRELHTQQDLCDLSQWLARQIASASRAAHRKPVPWYIQNFKDSDTVLTGKGSLHPWKEDDLRAVLPLLQEAMPSARLRGVA